MCYFLPLPGIRKKEQIELYLAASSSHTVHSPLEHDAPRDQVNLGKRWRQIHFFTHGWEPVQPETSTRPNEDLGTADWWATDMMPPFRSAQLPAKKKTSLSGLEVSLYKTSFIINTPLIKSTINQQSSLTRPSWKLSSISPTWVVKSLYILRLTKKWTMDLPM